MLILSSSKWLFLGFFLVVLGLTAAVCAVSLWPALKQLRDGLRQMPRTPREWREAVSTWWRDLASEWQTAVVWWRNRR